MNVFQRYTLASLKKNRSRTLVTIIGIVLSMALITAVIEGAFSGVSFLIRSEEARLGRFHAFYYSLSPEEREAARDQKNIRESAVWKTMGFGKLPFENTEKPYLLVRSVSENFMDLISVHLQSGHWPENSSEILVPSHLMREDAWTLQIGDTITLPVGRRLWQGQELNEFNPWDPFAEEEIDGEEKTYTIVGVYERFDLLLEDYSFPGYTVLTGWDEAEGLDSWVFFTVKNPARFYEDMDRYAISDQWSEHLDLLRFNGSIRSRGIANAIYGFAAVLIFLIAFGSVSLIYNSFAISVSERTKQFGILKSIGASNRQIRQSIFFEAFVLGLSGVAAGAVIGCVGIGVTLWALRDAFRMFSFDSQVEMRLVISPLGLLIAALVCMATTMISAWIPERRASRISAIDAIRQTEDIRVRSRDVRVSRLTGKLFGFEGLLAAKNFKRNRKRYRATVLSLFLSVTLFISSASFCSYLTDMVTGVTSDDAAYDLYYYTMGADQPDPDTLLKTFLETPGVSEGCYALSRSSELYIPSDSLSSDYASYNESSPQDVLTYGVLAFLDDAAFSRYCRENGFDPALFSDPAAPRGLFYNQETARASDENGNLVFRKCEVLNPAKVPCEIYMAQIADIPGYVQFEVDDGKYYYYPEEVMSEAASHWNQGDDNYMPDRSLARVLTEEEAEQRFTFTVGAVTDASLPFSSRQQTVLIYPCSLKDEVLSGSELTMDDTRFFLNAPDHAAAYSAIEQYLKEKNMDSSRLFDQAAEKESQRMLVTVVRVFSYGFIVLISLIAMANVFNTISTSVMLRRREFAMLRSIGFSDRSFRKMLNYECVIFGFRGLLWGLPAAFLMTYVIYRVTESAVQQSFYIPWYSVVIAAGSVFAVVFATMMYAAGVIRKDNPIDALKQENL